MHNFTKEEITSDLRNRYQGYRIKFKINDNQIKLYDKGNNLRIEVTINNPRDFKVMKEKEKIIDHQKLEKCKVWIPMEKSISNLYRYIEISKNITNRYIETLPEIEIENKVPISDIKEFGVYISILTPLRLIAIILLLLTLLVITIKYDTLSSLIECQN